MRAKRSKDARLVEKFGKQKDSLAAEAPLQQPVCSTTSTDNEKTVYTGGEDDHDELKVRNLKKTQTFIGFEPFVGSELAWMAVITVLII